MTYCAVGGDHDASGNTEVSAVQIPLNQKAMPTGVEGYFLAAFCDQHQKESKEWPPGAYYGKVRVIDSEG